MIPKFYKVHVLFRSYSPNYHGSHVLTEYFYYLKTTALLGNCAIL